MIKWICGIMWILTILCGVIASIKHEELMEIDPGTPRIGMWERLWYGAACIACADFFESLFSN